MATTKATLPADKAALRDERLPKEEARAVVMTEQNGLLINDKAYFEVLNSIKKQIRDAQYRAVLGVNQQQILLYWNIGKTISANVRYGNKFVENLARDIKTEFPNSTGYSVRNLKYMNRFARFVDDFQIVQTLSAQLTWSHNILNFYLSAIDDILRHLQDNPKIF